MGRAELPQLSGRPFITDGGMETTLIFHRGLELPHFAAFHLLADERGTEELRRYFEPYLAFARDAGVGVVLDTPTWRASADWGALLGYSAVEIDDVNRRAVELLEDVRGDAADVVVCGCVGPRGDGYSADTRLTADEAQRYHSRQVGVFADTSAQLVAALTLTYADEAIGIVRAAEEAGTPCAISFTVETDGRLPSGEGLGEAIDRVDAETDGAAAYFMVNCAHPTHFAGALEAAPWIERLRGVRANASRLSHAELDEAEALDEGDPGELAGSFVALRDRLPAVTIVGGCCGTDVRHVGAVCRAWNA
ncbi:MAG TPA: homocysteine S-methyltransferase family protein [Gaiellaceae bacterium]